MQMSRSIDPSRFDAGKPEEICQCGHPARHHLSSSGACFSPAGAAVLCPSLCRGFRRDPQANGAARANAERAKREYDRVDAIAAYVDAAWTGDGWRPSELMTIGYAVLVTGPHPENAAPFLDDMIDEARRRYRAGFYADPFTRSPQRR
jgi:hypothetical protein